VLIGDLHRDVFGHSKLARKYSEVNRFQRVRIVDLREIDVADDLCDARNDLLGRRECQNLRQRYRQVSA